MPPVLCILMLNIQILRSVLVSRIAFLPCNPTGAFEAAITDASTRPDAAPSAPYEQTSAWEPPDPPPNPSALFPTHLLKSPTGNMKYPVSGVNMPASAVYAPHAAAAIPNAPPALMAPVEGAM